MISVELISRPAKLSGCLGVAKIMNVINVSLHDGATQ